MNLLPWREALRQQAVKKGRYLLGAWLIVIVSLSLPFFLAFQSTQEEIDFLLLKQKEQQEQKVFLQQQIEEMVLKVPSTAPKKTLKAEKILEMLHLLKNLPLTEGTLQHLDWQKGELVLTGQALGQGEFSQLENYLRTSPQVKNLQLRQFHTTASHISFDFRLQMEE